MSNRDMMHPPETIPFSLSRLNLAYDAHCDLCPNGGCCVGCRETSLMRLHKCWHIATRSDDFDKAVFTRMFSLRYGQDSVDTALHHKYSGHFSRSMKWQRQALSQFIDAIYKGELEKLPTSTSFTPDEEVSRLPTRELLERCGELTRHLQRLHAELASRMRHTELNAEAPPIRTVTVEQNPDYLQEPAGPTIDLTPTPPSSYAATESSEVKGLRSNILQFWTVDGDSRTHKFVQLPLHTPRFLSMLLELAHHYSWEHTTRMLNHIIIERVRHPRNPEEKARYPKLDDWRRVLAICTSLGFPSFVPDRIQDHDLVGINFRMTDSGLLKEGNSFSPCRDDLGVSGGPGISSTTVLSSFSSVLKRSLVSTPQIMIFLCVEKLTTRPPINSGPDEARVCDMADLWLQGDLEMLL
ncbi:hypothetical protein BJ170DRAFT_598801 [Xylariales sp. AK1849]|nr:hypothetical protein BJ170DRAFT_598801 [Xylariales sp. AK1849]